MIFKKNLTAHKSFVLFSFQVASSSAAVLREEIGGDALGGKVYRSPLQLRKRKEYFYEDGAESKPIDANTDATGVELHKVRNLRSTF